MSPRGLVALILVLALAVAALYWLDRKKAEAPAASEAPLLATFTEDALRRIELECDASPVTLVHAKGGGWTIERPFAADADPRRVRELVAALQDARVRKVIAEKGAPLSSFGLAPASCSVTLGLASGEPPVTLRLGRGSPVGTERYASADGASVVFVDGSLHAVMSRGAEALRERRLFPVEAEDVSRIDLARPDGPLALAKDGDLWRLSAPIEDAASAAASMSLVRAVTSLAISEGTSTPAPSVVRPDRRVGITIVTKSSPSPLTAFLAAQGIQGTRLGWRQDGRLAGLVADDAVPELARSVESFREPRLTSFSVPDVRSIAVDRGAAHHRVSRAGEGKPWSGLDGTRPFAVDDGRVAELLDRLRGVSASGFASSPPAAPATATIVVSGEKAELARLTYGPRARAAGSDEETLWATSPARPGVVFIVPAAHLGPIPGRPSDWGAAR